MKCCVCYCIDDNDYNNILLYCSLFSLRKHDETRVVIMTNLNNKFVNYFREFNNVEIMYIDDIYKEKFRGIQSSYFTREDMKQEQFRKDISNMTYFRLEIPILLADYDRVLYLDTDTEIKINLSDIFNLDFGEYEIIGQYNAESHLEECLSKLAEYDIHVFDNYLYNKNDYICAGIILFNNEKIRETNYQERFQSYIDFEHEYYAIHLWKDEFLINMGFICKSSKLLDCEDEREYKTSMQLNTNSYVVHYIWKNKCNLIEKYKDILKMMGLL